MSERSEVLTWERFGEATRALAEAVHADGYRPDIVLAVARGGLLPAGAISYLLGVKNVFTMNVEFYTGVDERLAMPVMLPPILNAIDMKGERVLVVDDIADTGRTLQLVLDFCRDHVEDVRSAVLYAKPGSVVRCDYVWASADAWITFPWDRSVVEESRQGAAEA
ncbi:MAG: phosphoribosyltransferase [Candidatus Dormibacteraeota bacterium]|nr:phosphoribosyltransferase [Candidatus Dormibacteraeota bacterium]